MTLPLQSSLRIRPAVIGIALALLAGCQSAPPRPATMTAERQEMAAMHEQVAKCLRSSQPLGTCQQEMVRHCEAMKTEGCSMMEMHRMHGMGGKEPQAPGAGKDEPHKH
ncbi:MAG: hypothetical protein RLZZ403_191 [Pseudomonadota bacterium]|jgi:hypothetical protein